MRYHPGLMLVIGAPMLAPCSALGQDLFPGDAELALPDDEYADEYEYEDAELPEVEGIDEAEEPGSGLSDHPRKGREEPARSSEDVDRPGLLIEEFELNEADVVYSAALKLQSRYDAPAAVHVITDREIEAMGARSLADVLRIVPGIGVRSWMSGYHNVMIRGMLGSEVVSTRILWLEDGVSFNDVRDGGVWLDDTFPLELIKRIEIILGPGSALYGTNAFQGVINIYYKDAGSIPEQGQYRMSYGSFARKTMSATFARKEEGISLLLHASGGSTDGPGLISDHLAQGDAQRSSYSKGQGCSLGLGEADRVCAQHGDESRECLQATAGVLDGCGGEACADATRRANEMCLRDGLESESCQEARRDAAAGCAVPAAVGSVSSKRRWLHLRARGSIDPVSVSVGFKHLDANFDGALFFPNNFYEFGHQELFANGLINRDLMPGLNLKVVGSVRYFQNKFSDYSDYRASELLPGGRLAAPEVLELFPQDFARKIDYDIDQYKGSLIVQTQWDMFPHASWGRSELIGGAGLRYEAIDSVELMKGRRERSFNNYSVYLQDELRLLRGHLLLTAGGRVDTHNEYPAVVSYRGAMLVKPVDSLRLRLSAGSAFKEPAMWQLYIDHIDAQGNPDLTPERLVNVEGGVSWQVIEELELRLDGFATWMRDIIDNQFDSDLAIPVLNSLGHPHFGKFHPTQRKAAAFLGGFETSARLVVDDSWSAGASYSFLHTDDGQGRPLPYDYPHRISAFVIRGQRHCRGSLKVHWVDSTTDTGGPVPVTVPDYWLIQARGQIDLLAGIALGVDASLVLSEGIHNTDRHLAYDEMSSVPMPRYVLSVDLAYPSG